jgi:hypothetical protein
MKKVRMGQCSHAIEVMQILHREATPRQGDMMKTDSAGSAPTSVIKGVVIPGKFLVQKAFSGMTA